MIFLRQRRKVGLPLVRESPVVSLTGDLSSTDECAERRRRGAQARLVEFSNRGLLPLSRQEGTMDVMWPQCAGLDVHKDTVVACRRVQKGRDVQYEVRQFSTVTKELLELGDYFRRRDLERVAQCLAKRIREMGYEVAITKAA